MEQVRFEFVAVVDEESSENENDELAKLWGLKNQSFGDNSDKPQPIRTKFGICAKVKERQRSANFGRDL